MSSGRVKTKRWLMIFEKENSQYVEPVMQWTAGNSTLNQVRLFFQTKEEAIAHAQKNGWEFHVIEPKEPKITPKSYTNNFTRPIVD